MHQSEAVNNQIHHNKPLIRLLTLTCRLSFTTWRIHGRSTVYIALYNQVVKVKRRDFDVHALHQIWNDEFSFSSLNSDAFSFQCISNEDRFHLMNVYEAKIMCLNLVLESQLLILFNLIRFMWYLRAQCTIEAQQTHTYKNTFWQMSTAESHCGMLTRFC